jgi:hypothetical protein
MDVINMTGQIQFVPYLVFPIALLPDTVFAFRQPGETDCFPFRYSARKSPLKQRPAFRIICIPLGEPPYRMQVFGQHHHRHS